MSKFYSVPNSEVIYMPVMPVNLHQRPFVFTPVYLRW